MAYLKGIQRAKCRDCDLLATTTLFNRYNERIADFCYHHARLALSVANENEDGRPFNPPGPR